jgi:hypothetical protein
MAEELSEFQKTINRLREEEEKWEAQQNAAVYKSLNPSLNLEVIRATNDIFDRERELNKIGEEANIYGELGGLFTEVGLVLEGSRRNLKAAPLITKAIKGAKGLRTASRVSLLSPEPVSKFGTVPMWLMSEAFVAGGANLAGQWVRSTFSNHNFSLGELGASTLFGMGAAPVITKAETTLSAIGKSAAQKKAIKITGMTLDEMGVLSSKKLSKKLAERYGVPFVTGAAFAMGETAFRESLEIALNERENRSTWNYLILTGAIGGSANGFFKALGATTWGRNQAAGAADDALNKMKEKLVTAQKQIDEINKIPEPDRFQAREQLKYSKIRAAKELEDLKGSIAFLEQTAENLKANNKYMSAIEEAPAVNVKQIKEAVPEDRTPTPRDKSKYGDEIDKIIRDAQEDVAARAAKIEEQDWKEGVATLTETDVSISTRARDIDALLQDDISESIGAYSKKLTDGIIDAEEGAKLLKLIDDKIELDTKVLDPYKVLFGRGLRSLREDIDIYKVQRGSEFSLRAKKSQESWKSFRNELKKNLDEKTPFDGITKRVDDIEIAIKNVNKEGKEVAEAVTRLRKSKKTYDPAKLVEQEIKRLEKAIQKEKDIAKAPEVAGEVKKPKAEQTEEIKQLKQELARQKKLAKDAEKYTKLQKELDNLLGMTPEDFLKLSKEKQAQKALKKQGPKTKTDQLQDDIKAKLKELRKAAKSIERREALAKHNKFFEELRDTYLSNIWKDRSHLLYRVASRWTTLRQLALIDQLPSVMAGVYSGSWLTVKNGLARPITTSFKEGVKTVAPAKVLKLVGSEKNDWDTTKKLVVNEYLTAAELFKDLSTTFKAAKMRAKTLESVTDIDTGSKFNLNEKEVNLSTYARTVARAQESSTAIAERRTRLMEAIDLSKSASMRQIVNVLSLGYRGIVAVDEVFYRQNVKANIHRAAGTKAIFEAPNDAVAQAKIKEKFIEDSWEKRASGIPALRETDDNFAAINSIRQDMFYTLNDPEAGDIYQGFAETIVKRIKGATDKSPLGKLGTAALMPFINIAVRGASVSAKTLTAPVGMISPKFAGAVKFYRDKIKENLKDIEIDKVKKREAIESGDIKLAEEIQEEIIRKERVIELNQARMLEHKADYMSYALMGGAAFAFALRSSMTDEPFITGSMAWMTDAQKKRALENGAIPYTMKTPFGNFDLRKAMPFNLPLVVAADLGSFLKAQEMDEEFPDAKILKEGQNVISVLTSAVAQLNKELPFNQGLKSLGEIFMPESLQSLQDTMTDLGASYSLVPAQVQKLARLYSGNDKVEDLKGGTFIDRVLYRTLGIGTPNKRVDIFGDFEKSSKNFFTETIQIAPLSDTIHEFEEYRKLAGYDWTGSLPTELPRTFVAGISMTDFINEEGETLKTVFARRLRARSERKDGVKRKIRKLLKTKKYRNILRNGEVTGVISADNMYEIPAIQEIGKLIRNSWKEEKERMLDEIKKGKFGKDFINEEGEQLNELLENYESVEGQEIKLNLLNFEDL